MHESPEPPAGPGSPATPAGPGSPASSAAPAAPPAPTTPAPRAGLGRLGIWSLELRGADKPEIHETAAALEQQGWRAFWIAGATGRGLWADAEGLLTAAPRASVAFGVMSIWSPDARVVGAEHERLTAAFGNRLIVGLGVSTAENAAAVGREFGSPLKAMNRYLDELDQARPTVTRFWSRRSRTS
jgi:hypothetical protein